MKWQRKTKISLETLAGSRRCQIALDLSRTREIVEAAGRSVLQVFWQIDFVSTPVAK